MGLMRSSQRGVAAAMEFSPVTSCNVMPVTSQGQVRSFSVEPSLENAYNVKSASVVKAAFRKRLEGAKEQALVGGGEVRIKKQHAGGKLTARERIEVLLDQVWYTCYVQ
jgi:hypothetical protein